MDFEPREFWRTTTSAAPLEPYLQRLAEPADLRLAEPRLPALLDLGIQPVVRFLRPFHNLGWIR